MDFKKTSIEMVPTGNELQRCGNRKDIFRYCEILLEYNQYVNVISRKITQDGLEQLLNESLILNSYINCDTVIDAGSGNGILGIPLSLLDENKSRRFVLVEPKQKKTAFLKKVKKEMQLENIWIESASIEEFLKKKQNRTSGGCYSIIARGFPNLDVFCGFLNKDLVNEVILITSENKIKKNQIQLESVRKKIYNIPLRTELKILILRPTEKTTRGRKHEKKM